MKYIYVSCLALLLTSCSPVKGYVGPELPPEKVSLIKTSYDENEVEVRTSSLNGIDFSSPGITVLPGNQSFALSITVKEPPFDCETYSTMDYDGYDRCRRKDKGDCDCYDYLTVWKKCYREVRDGHCEGNLNTIAGGQYQIAVRKENEGAAINIYGPTSGKGKCSTAERRVDKDEESLGSGKYVANSNGIYYCR